MRSIGTLKLTKPAEGEDSYPYTFPNRRIFCVGRMMVAVALCTMIAAGNSLADASTSATPRIDGSAVSSANRPDPIEQAKTLVNKAYAILNNPNLSLAEERRQMKALGEPYFDADEMARSALGYHWNKLTPEQRAEFVKLFSAFIEEAVLSKIQDYNGQTIEFIREVPQGAGYTEVQSKVIQKDAEPIPVNLMLRLVDGKWKLYDITVDQISVTANYRNQFNRVINDEGFPTLMAKLKKKKDELNALLGKSSSARK